MLSVMHKLRHAADISRRHLLCTISSHSVHGPTYSSFRAPPSHSITANAACRMRQHERRSGDTPPPDMVTRQIWTCTFLTQTGVLLASSPQWPRALLCVPKSCSSSTHVPPHDGVARRAPRAASPSFLRRIERRAATARHLEVRALPAHAAGHVRALRSRGCLPGHLR